jgi:hypothetical protein
MPSVASPRGEIPLRIEVVAAAAAGANMVAGAGKSRALSNTGLMDVGC